MQEGLYIWTAAKSALAVIKSEMVRSIKRAIKDGRLKTSFRADEVIEQCPGFSKGSYKRMLYRHRVGNPDDTTEYFMKNYDGSFSLTPAFRK